MVVMYLGLPRPDPVSRELTLTGLHPGAGVEQAREMTGWDLELARAGEMTNPPAGQELEVLRDPQARTGA